MNWWAMTRILCGAMIASSLPVLIWPEQGFPPTGEHSIKSVVEVKTDGANLIPFLRSFTVSLGLICRKCLL